MEERPGYIDPSLPVRLLFREELEELALMLMYDQAVLEPGGPGLGVGLRPGEAAEGHRVWIHPIRRPTPHTPTNSEWATI